MKVSQVAVLGRRRTKFQGRKVGRILKSALKDYGGLLIGDFLYLFDHSVPDVRSCSAVRSWSRGQCSVIARACLEQLNMIMVVLVVDFDVDGGPTAAASFRNNRLEIL